MKEIENFRATPFFSFPTPSLFHLENKHRVLEWVIITM